MDDLNKRQMLAIALSFVVLMLWLAFFVKQAPPRPKPSPPSAEAPQKPVAALAAPVKLPVQQGTKAEEIVVEGDLYRVTLSTQGAVIKSWILTKYRDEKEDPLDVVNRAACETLGFPMSFNLADANLAKQLNEAVYVVKARGTSLTAPAKLEFTYSDGKIQARKQFTFGPGYEMRAEVSLFDGQRHLPIEVAWTGGFGDHSLPTKNEDAIRRAVFSTPEKLDNVVQGKVKEDRLIAGPLTLAGLEDRYFVDIFLPEAPDKPFPQEVGFRLIRRPWSPPEWKEKEPPRPLAALLVSAQPKPLAFRLFVAPKDLDVLRAAKPPLDSLVDFGWFGVVAKPLFIALRYIHDHWGHNYGWAIVILTVLINLAMFPLKLKSLRSAQEMQRIAPQVKDIQERYKHYKFNDPRKQRMNQEIMKLYQEHGVNPVGGCLPMVLQLPFLYGFYRVLDQAIELRHAPWVLWVKDLSSPDDFHLLGFPLPILPTVMIATTFALQKMTPIATADPAQQRMMMIMPLVFGIMFYNFASGLVLYWLTQNIVGIGQQAFINKMMPPPPPVPVQRKPASAKE